jgi:hypothetical protein
MIAASYFGFGFVLGCLVMLIIIALGVVFIDWFDRYTHPTMFRHLDNNEGARPAQVVSTDCREMRPAHLGGKEARMSEPLDRTD